MYAAQIDRRDFLRYAAAFGTTLPFVGLGRADAAPEPELVARRVFFDNPDCGNVRVSPDGQHLAYLAPLDGVRNLWVTPLADPHAAQPLTRATDRNLSLYFRWAHTNRHLVFFQERDGDENWRASSVDIESAAIVPLTPERGVRSFLQELDRKFSDEILLRHNQRDKRFFDLFRINVVTGASKLLYENHDYVGLITDSDFQIRLGERFAADGTAEYFERLPDGAWALFTTVPIGDVDATHMIDFSADGKTLYLLDSRGRDKAALVALDMATRETTVLAADDEADIVEVSFANRRPLAARAIKDRARWHAVDASAEQDLAHLAAYGAGDVEFVSRSSGNRMVTVFFERDTTSGEYALLDRQTREVRTLFQQRQGLNLVALRKMEPVTIPARDGLHLNGYLTMPGTEAGTVRLPLVLVLISP
jgi:dipeptidyl aminopeptidase/acylaminoacyl peptidase